MKNFLSVAFMTLLSMAAMAQSGVIDINGTTYNVDTIQHYMVGPGVDYTQFNVKIGSNTHRLFLLEADLTNPYLKIEENPSQDKLGTVEQLVRTETRIDSVGHRTIGAVNCNFWVVASQNTGSNEGLLSQPFAGTAKDGMLITEPDTWNQGHGDRGFVMIDDMGRALIRNMSWNGRLIKGNKSYAIRDCNRTRVTAKANEIALFNRYIGRATRAIPDTAVEVIFEPIEGQEWTINDTMTCVVRAINHTGGTTLTGKMGALQGRGNGLTRINTCAGKVGDTFQLYLGMYSSSLTTDDNVSADSITPKVMQMVTGNCLVMANGVLTSRNTNETYNNQNYPRTMLATNNEGNKLWLLVSEKPGNYTAQMCGILKNCGATWASGLDGGGSAQMLLHGAIQNTTTEGTPRGVSNSLWVISTAPDDDMATSLSSSTKEIKLPKYCVSKPVFNVYNQYGFLIKKDFADVTLSCPPEVGYITEDGQFVCLGSGVLTASYGNASLDIPVVALESSKPAFRLQKVLIDNKHTYCVEVETHTSNGKQTLLSSALTWQSADSGICSVDEDGNITGVSNGSTWVYGTLEDQTDSLNVVVEIANSPIIDIVDFTIDNKDWTPTCSVTTNSVVFKPSNEGSILTLSYKKSRSPIITINPSISVYGLPKNIELELESKNFPMTSFSINLVTQSTGTNAYAITTLPAADTIINISIKDFLGDDIAIYPLIFESIKINVDATVNEGNYEMLFKSLRAIYDSEYTDVENISSKDNISSTRKVMIDGQLYILKDNKLFNILGHEIR